MSKYQKGKIYKIISMSHPELVYFGSTVQKLCKRLSAHRAELGKKHMTSHSVMAFNDYDIILVENFPCNSKEELHQRESFYITNNECVNKQNPWVSEEQKALNFRNYLEANKAIIKEKDCARHKIWYQENKQKVAEKYEQNKEEIYQQKSQKIVCECGLSVMIAQMARHKRSDVHLNLLNPKNELENDKLTVVCECGCKVNKYNLIRHKRSPKHLDILQNLNI